MIPGRPVINPWPVILEYVEANHTHHDGTPMLANNMASENVTRLLGPLA